VEILYLSSTAARMIRYVREKSAASNSHLMSRLTAICAKPGISNRSTCGDQLGMIVPRTSPTFVSELILLI
jgi:hypothetical protein